MRIAFIASGLEPGRDGVGDYTRRLAAECVRQGHSSIIVGLNDMRVSLPAFGNQESEGTNVPVLRLPAALPWNSRVAKARAWINSFDPDWNSLQFVPFGFHPRGFCFGLGRRLAQISRQVNWHIMFHELWLGLGYRASVKHQLCGIVQRITVRNMIRRLQPKVQHTQTEPYREILAREGISASILPLCGNIPWVKGDAWEDILEPLTARVMGRRPDRSSLYLAGVFGSVHPEWDALKAVAALLPLVERFNKQLVVAFLGKNNLAPAIIEDLKSKLQQRALVIVTGERTSTEISRLLQTLDLGLATTPRRLIQKSGTVAAMLEHGLPVLVIRDDWRLGQAVGASEEPDSKFLTPKEMASLDALPVRQCADSAELRIASIAAKMLGEMNPGPTTGGLSYETASACSN